MLRVCHLVDATGGDKAMWGKERMVYQLMHAQRDEGRVEPSLAAFRPNFLSLTLQAEGFPVLLLDQTHRALPVASLTRLASMLRKDPNLILHTHCYKANILGRLVRSLASPRTTLISTCHGWCDDDRKLYIYNRLDRASSAMSDITVVCAPHMFDMLPTNRAVQYVPNAVPDAVPASPAARLAARAKYGFSAGDFVAGALTRLTVLKGINNLIEAADTRISQVSWAVAGGGPMESAVRDRQAVDFRYVGVVNPSADFLNAIDVFVQPSLLEGMSLSLLEAMRASLPIVATRAGATEHAVTDGVEALLVPTGDARALAQAVQRLYLDRQLAGRLAANARRRFEKDFRIQRQHDAYLGIYEQQLRQVSYKVPFSGTSVRTS